jgi:hypothetical protein
MADEPEVHGLLALMLSPGLEIAEVDLAVWHC